MADCHATQPDTRVSDGRRERRIPWTGRAESLESSEHCLKQRRLTCLARDVGLYVSHSVAHRKGQPARSVWRCRSAKSRPIKSRGNASWSIQPVSLPSWQIIPPCLFSSPFASLFFLYRTVTSSHTLLCFHRCIYALLAALISPLDRAPINRQSHHLALFSFLASNPFSPPASA